MRKLMLLGAMLAVVLVAAAPAIAQVAQGFSESRDKSGTASPSVAVSNKGDNVNLCPTVQQVAQTGNVLNEQGVVQYKTDTDDISFSGSEITVTPSETATCTQTMEQAAAAG
jgi:protein-disulfide isomerase